MLLTTVTQSCLQPAVHLLSTLASGACGDLWFTPTQHVLNIPTDIVFALFSVYRADTKFKINFSGVTQLFIAVAIFGFSRKDFLCR